jgi:hypothetical protein
VFQFLLVVTIFFLINGNIFNYSLAIEPCSFGSCGLSKCNAKAIPPNPPASKHCGEPIFAQSYINAYNTAFNQPANRQRALYEYGLFLSNEVNSNFVPGTFGYDEQYNTLSQSFYINYLQDDANYCNGNPYLFISAGSGGGSGYMDWIGL